MAIKATSLDFWKPDGYDLVRNGDNVISHNADVANGHLVNQDFRLSSIEALAEPITPPTTRPTNLALAPDGVPYILAGANEIAVYAGTDGNYYFTEA